MDPIGSRPALASMAGPFVFELGGRTFVLDADAAPDPFALYAELRAQFLAESKDPLTVVNERIADAEKAGRPFAPSVVDALVKSALAASGRAEGKAEPSDADVLARVHTLAGSRALVYLRLRKADPTVTREWVAEHLPDMDARNAVLERLLLHSGLKALDEKKA